LLQIQTIIWVLAFLVLSQNHSVLVVNAVPSQTHTHTNSETYAIGMTTIPPRFSSVHHTILSWLGQVNNENNISQNNDKHFLYPSYVFVFVPNKYKRFKVKKNHVSKSEINHNNNSSSSSADSLTDILIEKFSQMSRSRSELIHSCRIRVLGPNGKSSDIEVSHNSTHQQQQLQQLCIIHVVVAAVQDDLGPAVKYAGCMQMAHEWDIHSSPVDYPSLALHAVPTQWVVSDDDVAYSPTTLSRYSQSRKLEGLELELTLGQEGNSDKSGTRSTLTLAGSPTQTQTQIKTQSQEMILKNTVFTHFSEDYRLILKLDDEPFKRPVMHIQGVDTVCFPASLFQQHRSHFNSMWNSNHDSDIDNMSDITTHTHTHITIPVATLAIELFNAGLRYFHRKCPSSFYQDDYIVSFLLNIGDVHVQSLWNNDHVAKHVNDVSKSHHQMHMHPNVHEREESTKECIAKNTNHAFLYLKEYEYQQKQQMYIKQMKMKMKMKPKPIKSNLNQRGVGVGGTKEREIEVKSEL